MYVLYICNCTDKIVIIKKLSQCTHDKALRKESVSILQLQAFNNFLKENLGL